LDFGDGDLKNNLSGGKGDFDSQHYFTDARLGKTFVLTDKPDRGLGLDLSVNGGYTTGTDGSFTDSAGLRYGTEDLHYGYIGGRARLFAVLPDRNVLWVPFISGTVDVQLGFDHTLKVPTQALIPKDTLTFQQEQTFWGGDVGVDFFTAGGLKGGIRGFYTGNSDINAGGGWAYLKVPL
jgi:hypothetical protein